MDEVAKYLVLLPQRRQRQLQEQIDAACASVSNSEELKTLHGTLAARVRAEVESYERVKRRAKELREAESATRRIALLLTFVVLLLAVGLGLFLADDRRLYNVHEFFAKWYYELFVHDPRRGNRLFLDKDEGYDMYA